MKKNKMMRLASLLLVAVLLTTSVISGTYAKYVTTGSAEATARVAKWGVTVAVSTDSLYADTYKNDDEIGDKAIEATVSVDSHNNDKVVAPGTTGSTTFTVSGNPEVAMRVTAKLEITNDVVIPANTEIATDVVLTEEYKPVIYTLKDGAGATIAQGSLSAINTTLGTYTKDYPVSTTAINETFTLSWEWPFEGVNDTADTYLGNVAAGTIKDANTSTNINFDLVVTATQID